MCGKLADHGHGVLKHEQVTRLRALNQHGLDLSDNICFGLTYECQTYDSHRQNGCAPTILQTQHNVLRLVEELGKSNNGALAFIHRMRRRKFIDL